MVTKWQVIAPNGQSVVINTGGYGDTQYAHGQITRNEVAAKLFPQYFIPIHEEVKVPVKAPTTIPTETAGTAVDTKPTLEEQLLKEENVNTESKPEMLTEVPKTQEVAPESEKPEPEEAGETILVEVKPTKTRKGKGK